MIKNIKINNYKCFKNFEIKAFKRINILVGDNNSGKTSLLEAIALLDPKTFKAKNDVIKNAISFCTDSYLKNKDDLPNKFMLAFFKKIFEDYSIFFNKRNIEEPIFIEADFNSLKKDSKSDFLVKFENQIIKEIVDYYYNSKSDTVKVSFRVKGDSDEYIRESEFELSVAEDYGFLLLESPNSDFEDITFQYEEETDEYIFEEEMDDEEIIDEIELKLFLNEFYGNEENKLPKLQIF